MQIHDTITAGLSHSQTRQPGKMVQSGFTSVFEASLAEAKHRKPLDLPGPQAQRQTTARDALIELGTISPSQPTVSHLLVDHSEYGPNCWEIVHDTINEDKPYTQIPAGTRIFFDANSKEIIWEGAGQGPPDLDRALAAGTAAPEYQPRNNQGAVDLDLLSSLESSGQQDLSSRDPDNQDREQTSISRAVDLASAKYELPRALICGVVKAESDFQPGAVSPAGAQGLMQLMPGTASELGVTDPFDIQENVDAGSRYLKKMLELFDGDVRQALAAYNAGPGTMSRHQGEIPYQETRLYVERVLSFFQNRA